MKRNLLYYGERLAAWIAAVIFLQTLYFKFTGHPDSRFIFTELGGEPFLRLGLGVVEAIIALLLIWPRTAALGAFLGLGVMAGAIGSHLFVLGLEVQGDGGTLFGLACATAVCCATVLVIRKGFLGGLLSRFTSKR